MQWDNPSEELAQAGPEVTRLRCVMTMDLNVGWHSLKMFSYHDVTRYYQRIQR